MMHGSDMVGHEFGLGEIWRSLQTYGKGVQTGPVGTRLGIILDTHLGIFLGNGRDHAGVQATGEQHAIGHIRHQLSLHGGLEGIVDNLHTGGIVLHRVVLHPVSTIIPLHAWIHAPVVMAGQERLIALALTFEGLQLGSHIDSAVAVVAYIKRDHPDRIAGNQELILFLVVEHEGEDATQLFEEIDALVAIEGQYHLTVGTRLELILPRIAATDFLMVIDLAIHGKHQFLIRREEGLSTRLRVHDTQALMRQDG